MFDEFFVHLCEDASPSSPKSFQALYTQAAFCETRCGVVSKGSRFGVGIADSLILYQIHEPLPKLNKGA